MIEMEYFLSQLILIINDNSNIILIRFRFTYIVICKLLIRMFLIITKYYCSHLSSNDQYWDYERKFQGFNIFSSLCISLYNFMKFYQILFPRNYHFWWIKDWQRYSLHSNVNIHLRNCITPSLSGYLLLYKRYIIEIKCLLVTIFQLLVNILFR